MHSRRGFIAACGAAAVAACTRSGPDRVAEPARAAAAPPAHPPMPDFYGAITDEPFPIGAIPDGAIAPEYWRQEVANPFPEHPHGTIVVDPDRAMLHFIESPETATRYGVSVGGAGFAWEGTARLQFTRDWPRWNVPASMIERQPDLAPYSVENGGMDPGPDNPMGARALYLFQNGRDTLYRVHGNAVPRELGRAVSSGCIRMLDHDVIHLEARHVHGASVIVLPSEGRGRFDAVY